MVKSLLAALACMVGCSFGLAQQQEDAPSQAKTKTQINAALNMAGCGPIEVHFDVNVDKTRHPSPLPEAGKALVYVFEDDQTGGATPTTRVGLDGRWMGANHPESYFFFAADPGEHRLCTNWQENIDSLSRLGAAIAFIAEAGKTYYFRTRITARRGQFAVDLKSVNSAEGQFLISSHFLGTSQVKRPEPIVQRPDAR